MRSFIIACTLLAFVLIFIFAVGALIKDNIDFLIDSLPAEKETIDRFKEEWKRSRGSLILSTDRSNIIRIDSLIETARIYFSADDLRGYADSLQQIKEALYEIRCFEEFSLENLI